MRLTGILALVLATAAIWITFRPTASLQAQQAAIMSPPAPWDPAATRVLIRYGVTATEAANWKGRIEPASTGARVIGVEGLHFAQQDRAAGDGAFSFSTRSWAPNNQQTDLSPILPGPRPVFPRLISPTDIPDLTGRISRSRLEPS